MEILKTTAQMQAWSKQKKQKGQTICFVPTMGFLHQGHTSLLDMGKPLCDELVLSIFVNPTQFGPTEDLDKYPSDLENDWALAKKAGVTAVFLPNKDAMYPENFQTRIALDHLPKFLCGKSRPVHFGGVATVVNTCSEKGASARKRMIVASAIRTSRVRSSIRCESSVPSPALSSSCFV